MHANQSWEEADENRHFSIRNLTSRRWSFTCFLRYIAQTSAHYWYRNRSCWCLIVHFLGERKMIFRSKKYFSRPPKMNYQVYTRPSILISAMGRSLSYSYSLFCLILYSAHVVDLIIWISWNSIPFEMKMNWLLYVTSVSKNDDTLTTAYISKCFIVSVFWNIC